MHRVVGTSLYVPCPMKDPFAVLADCVWCVQSIFWALITNPRLFKTMLPRYASVLVRMPCHAGADCATTASYQASYEGFAKAGYDQAHAEALMRRSVTLADQARQLFWDQHTGTYEVIAVTLDPTYQCVLIVLSFGSQIPNVCRPGVPAILRKSVPSMCFGVARPRHRQARRYTRV